MGRTEHLLVFRGILHDEALQDLLWIMEHYEEGCPEAEEKLAGAAGSLIRFAEEYGLSGNLWQNYIAWLLVNDENVFSRACEIKGTPEGSIARLAMRDLSVIKSWFTFPMARTGHFLHAAFMEEMTDYQCSGGGKLYSGRIRDRIMVLSRQLAQAADTSEFYFALVSFYHEFGVGKFGLHKAFRLSHEEFGRMEIEPIRNIAHVRLEDLVGYELQKQKLIENTEAFLEGRPANNCLLFGDAGTGKSSSIKGILNRYFDRGLRIVELYKHQFRDLNQLISRLKNRNYRFIIYMDDLSFEEFETEYKYLKAVIEGGLEKKPDNILIYATSNRRHLIRENMTDNLEQHDLHKGDTIQEKMSLAMRFGCTIYFGSPDKKEFRNIVKVLAERNGLDVPEEELLLEANKWELSHGGMSGRTAQQFITYMQGKPAADRPAENG